MNRAVGWRCCGGAAPGPAGARCCTCTAWRTPSCPPTWPPGTPSGGSTSMRPICARPVPAGGPGRRQPCGQRAQRLLRLPRRSGHPPAGGRRDRHGGGGGALRRRGHHRAVVPCPPGQPAGGRAHHRQPGPGPGVAVAGQATARAGGRYVRQASLTTAGQRTAQAPARPGDRLPGAGHEPGRRTRPAAPGGCCRWARSACWPGSGPRSGSGSTSPGSPWTGDCPTPSRSPPRSAGACSTRWAAGSGRTCPARSATSCCDGRAGYCTVTVTLG